MDLVDFDEGVFDGIVEEFEGFAARLDVPDVTFIPISALLGDNVVERSEAMPWYQGPPLLYHLEHVHIASDRNLIDVRFPVQWVIRPRSGGGTDYRAYAGQVAGGVCGRATRWSCCPAGSTRRSPGSTRSTGPSRRPFRRCRSRCGWPTTSTSAAARRSLRAHNQPTVSSSFECLLCWMSEQPLSPQRRYLVKHTTRTATVSALDVRYRIDARRNCTATRAPPRSS